MDARPTTADSKHHYPPQLWGRSTSSPTVPRLSTILGSNSQASLTSASLQPEHTHFAFPAHIDLLPILLPQQSSLYQAQLLQYNKLIAPGRGRGGGLQTPPLPPILSTSSVHVGTRSRSSSKVSNKDSSRARPGTQNCHGNRSTQNNKGDRALITGKDTSSSSKMPPSKTKQADLAPHPLPTRPNAISATSATHSNSVPSTPHQHARKFSFESREPSPNANHGHSPRSAYSETNGSVPSLRPLPPRNGGCQYETIPERSRRRMPYSMGSDRLEKSDLNKMRNKLSEDDERKLTTDMRELYDRLKPTDAVEEKRHKLVRKLEKLLNDTWPGHDIRVHLFGSSGNLLCSDDSDVDICITTPWKELEGVCMLADLLAKHGMEKVVCVSSAKVPIVKIWDPELGLACDMNVNNTLALENTRMIRTYVDIDERVRPLAMIIKYWTRQRIINDAAFGGTLSSYTWICMIIAFLQLRKPAVLPALHQQPHLKQSKRNDGIAAFADDLDKLRGFGNKNKSTWGELLFQFFRFYAHEFDYSEWALSIRLGRLMKKTEKKHWHLAINNQLCVEEPFNTMRNLGNTADDTSFRGIHLELRRAFELIADGKLGECCEQYVFPKEEERVWQKPASTSRPVLLRSASQQHNRGGRGGGNRGGNRQQGQFRSNNHGNNRRASSSIPYDSNPNQMYFPGYFMTPQDGVYMPTAATPELLQQLSQMQLQDNQFRFLQYAQTQQAAYAQQQAALASQQRLPNTAQSQSSNERSRTNSFDNPPLTAPIPQEMYFWSYQGHAFLPPGYTTYPSSPSTIQSSEHRRSPHRSAAPSEIGGTQVPGSSLRSQSQPASRPLPVAQSGFPGPINQTNGATSIPARHVNGVPIPSFMPDEVNDHDQESVASHTPPGEERHHGSYLDPASPAHSSNGTTSSMLAFGDIGPQKSAQTQTQNQGRRRLSSDQFPVSILERIKRTSRSPSPLGHNRAFSVGTNSAPLSQAPFPAANNRPPPDTKPLVVNGSAFKPSSANSSRQPSSSEGYASGGSFDNPLHISQQPNGTAARVDTSPVTMTPTSTTMEPKVSEQPLVVNGSSGNLGQIPGQYASSYGSDAISMYPNGVMPNGVMNYSPLSAMAFGPTMQFSPTSFQQKFVPRPHQPQSPLIAQLDLATENRLHQNTDLQHLSPVYETRTPSPTVMRKFELPANHSRSRPNMSSTGKDMKAEAKTKQRSPVVATSPKVDAASLAHPRINGIVRENGHTRASKSESDHATGSGWQKTKGRKKGADAKGKGEVYPQSEQLPKNESERKGG